MVDSSSTAGLSLASAGGTSGFPYLGMEAFQGGDCDIDSTALLLEFDQYVLDIQGKGLLN